MEHKDFLQLGEGAVGGGKRSAATAPPKIKESQEIGAVVDTGITRSNVTKGDSESDDFQRAWV